MTGAPLAGFAEIATKRVATLVSQAPISVLSASSTKAKSAASALAEICTRTVAAFGSSVNATRRSACQGRSDIWTEMFDIAIQGCGPGNSPPRANTAATISGTDEARILKRNITRRSLFPGPRYAGAYGWRIVNKTRY